MKAKKETIIDFIVAEIKKGKSRGDILAKVGNKWQTPPRTFDRYLKVAQLRHQAKRQVINKRKDELEVAEEVAALKTDIMTANERKQLLSQIARREIKIPNSKQQYDTKQQEWVTVEIEELPDHQAVIKAVSELNKMDGDYSPIQTKVELSTEKTVVIRPSRTKK